MATFDPNRYAHLFSKEPQWRDLLLDIADAFENSDLSKSLVQDYTIPDDGANTFFCDTTNGTFTVTLPYVANNEGRRIYIKNIGSSGNDITVSGKGADTIDGNATQAVADFECLAIAAHTEWGII